MSGVHKQLLAVPACRDQQHLVPPRAASRSHAGCAAGYDASAHISEETSRSAWAAPLGIVTAVGSNAIIGWLFTLAMLFATQVSPCRQRGGACGHSELGLCCALRRPSCSRRRKLRCLLDKPAAHGNLNALHAMLGCNGLQLAAAADSTPVPASLAPLTAVS